MIIPETQIFQYVLFLMSSFSEQPTFKQSYFVSRSPWCCRARVDLLSDSPYLCHCVFLQDRIDQLKGDRGSKEHGIFAVDKVAASPGVGGVTVRAPPKVILMIKWIT